MEMDCWGGDEEVGYSSAEPRPGIGPDLATWVEDRAAKGTKGLLCLQRNDVKGKGFRGYAPAVQPRAAKRSDSMGWDSSPSGGLPQYDALRDRHCRNLTTSLNYRLHARKYNYAVEATKLQRLRPTQLRHAASAVLSSDAADDSDWHDDSTRGVPPKRRAHSGPSPISSECTGGPSARGERKGLPPVPPRRAMPTDDEGHDGDVEPVLRPETNGASHAKKVVAPYTVPPRRPRRTLPPHARQTKESGRRAEQANTTINISNNNTTYHTVNNFSENKNEKAGVDIGDLLQRIEKLEEERAVLSEQIALERSTRSEMIARLNDEMQKKVKSTKQATSKEGKLKETMQALAAAQADVARLRERCKNAESRAERCLAAEQERRKLAVALQQKEAMYKELQDLLNKTESRLSMCDGGTAKERVQTTLDRDHLRNRLQQEARARAQLERRVELAEAEVLRVRAEADKTRRSASSGSRTGRREGKVEAELNVVKRERDKLALELRDRERLLEKERASNMSLVAERVRKEQQKTKEVESREQKALEKVEELTKRVCELEATTSKKQKEIGETKLSIARVEIEAQENAKQRATTEGRLKEVTRDLERVTAEKEKLAAAARALEDECAALRKRLASIEDDKDAQLRTKQLTWERERSELLQQTAKMRLQEQEFTHELRRHEDTVERLQRELAAKSKKKDDGSEKRCEGLEAEVRSLTSKMAQLQEKYDKLVAETSNSQKDRIIETLTNKLREADRRNEALSDCNTQLMHRLEKGERAQ